VHDRTEPFEVALKGAKPDGLATSPQTGPASEDTCGGSIEGAFPSEMF